MNEPTLALDRQDALPPRADPFVRGITVGDVNVSWAQGLRDFQAALVKPKQSIEHTFEPEKETAMLPAGLGFQQPRA